MSVRPAMTPATVREGARTAGSIGNELATIGSEVSALRVPEGVRPDLASELSVLGAAITQVGRAVGSQSSWLQQRALLFEQADAPGGRVWKILYTDRGLASPHLLIGRPLFLSGPRWRFPYGRGPYFFHPRLPWRPWPWSNGYRPRTPWADVLRESAAEAAADPDGFVTLGSAVPIGPPKIYRAADAVVAPAWERAADAALGVQENAARARTAGEALRVRSFDAFAPKPADSDSAGAA